MQTIAIIFQEIPVYKNAFMEFPVSNSAVYLPIDLDSYRVC